MQKKFLSLLLLTVVAAAGFNAQAANLVKNGSFETPLFSSKAWPYYFGNGEIPNWNSEGVGKYLINNVGGPFWDNGDCPDGSQVCGVQNPTSATQTVSGFVAGKTYAVSFAYNARTGGKVTMSVSLGGTTLVDSTVPTTVTSVGMGKPFYRFLAKYTAQAAGDLKLSIAQTNPGDNTLLVDDVSIQEEGSAPEMVVAPTSLDFGAVSTGLDNTANVTVRNSGGTTLTVSAITLGGTNQSAYALSGVTLPITVSPFGGSKTIGIICRPTADGVSNATVTITSDANTTKTVAVSMTATAYSKPTIINPSFEQPVKTDNSIGSGLIIPGWTGNCSVQKEGDPHYDNGKTPDGNQVLWLQQTSSRYQSIPGFKAKKPYKITLYANARNTGGSVATMRVRIDGVDVKDSPTTVTAIDGVNVHATPFRSYSFTFMPTKAGSHTLTIMHDNPTSQDRTLFVDNVSITETVDPVRQWSLFE